MAGFDEAKTISEQTTFLRRLSIAVFTAAVDVMAEEPDTVAHAERTAYAKKILGGLSLSEYGTAVMTNPSLQASGDMDDPPLFGISDSDLQFTVNSLFNAMAGVST